MVVILGNKGPLGFCIVSIMALFVMHDLYMEQSQEAEIKAQVEKASFTISTENQVHLKELQSRVSELESRLSSQGSTARNKIGQDRALPQAPSSSSALQDTPKQPYQAPAGNRADNRVGGKRIVDIYIDAGAYIGDTIDWFLKSYAHDERTKLYAFEANPQNHHSIMAYKENHPELDLTVLLKAVSNEAGNISFTTDNRQDVKTGGSIFNHNAVYLKGTKRVVVPSIDFVEWFREKVEDMDQYVVLKMDIEGAEITVLEAFCKLPMVLGLVDELIVEWHDRIQMPPNYTPRRREIEKCLAKNNVHVITWH